MKGENYFLIQKISFITIVFSFFILLFSIIFLSNYSILIALLILIIMLIATPTFLISGGVASFKYEKFRIGWMPNIFAKKEIPNGLLLKGNWAKIFGIIEISLGIGFILLIIITFIKIYLKIQTAA
jgi:hypothetical protein